MRSDVERGGESIFVIKTLLDKCIQAHLLRLSNLLPQILYIEIFALLCVHLEENWPQLNLLQNLDVAEQIE